MRIEARCRWLWLPLLLLLLLGCSEDRPLVPSVRPAQPSQAQPWFESIRPVGRHRWGDDRSLHYGWPGTGFSVRVSGRGLYVRLDDHARYHAVLLDGEEITWLSTRPGERRYRVLDPLPPGEHEVTVLRRTEGHLGPTTLLEVEVDGVMSPTPEPAVRVEVIGDSISTGYGNRGRSKRCKYSPRTQDALGTYASLATLPMGAELHTVAWSGKGVVHNYGDDRNEPLPEIYERSVPTEPDSRWDFADPADAVLINLGTNDFSTDGDPSEEEFVAGYFALLTRVRAHHPDAEILTTVAPLLGEQERAVVQVYVEQAIELRRREGDADMRWIDLHVRAKGWGCEWHPSAATHEAMAQRLEPELRQALQ